VIVTIENRLYDKRYSALISGRPIKNPNFSVEVSRKKLSKKL
jgi:hypothetical protein